MKQYKTIQEWLDDHIKNKMVKGFLPSAIVKEVPDITIRDVYDVCEEYKKQGKLAIQYEILCPNCYHSLGIYETLSGMPRQIEYCDRCEEEEINPVLNSIVCYKIIR